MTPKERAQRACGKDGAGLCGLEFDVVVEHVFRSIRAALRERDARWAAAVNLEYEVRANVFSLSEEECQRKLAPLRALLEEAGK